MDILINGEKCSFISGKDILLTQTAHEVLSDLVNDMKSSFGVQAWEETYWLKANGDLIYKIAGEIPEAIEFCSIDTTHWSIKQDYKH